MKVSRRRLLELGVLQAATTAFSTVVSPRSGEARSLGRPPGVSVLQGATDESKTQFSVLRPANQALDYTILNSTGQEWLPAQMAHHNFPGQSHVIDKVFISGLYLNEIFRLNIRDKNTGVLVDQREFKMLDLQNPQLNFAVCSCMDDSQHSPAIWLDLLEKAPDFLIFAGDSTYCDMGYSRYEGAARLWDRFTQARQTLQIYFSPRLVPIFATWDDHDFGKNDAGYDFAHAQASRENFTSFFAMDPQYCLPLESGPGVSSAFIVGAQQFILMDNRSFRVSGFSDRPYAHWGQEQEEWMLNRVERHPGITWLVNGSQMFPQMFFKQSFSKEHPVQFDRVRRRLSTIKSKVILVSGDVHFSEVSKIEKEALGYTTYELTSSSIHSQNFPGTPGLIWNSRRIASTGERNYLLINSRPVDLGCRFSVESRSAQNRVNFNLQLSV